MSSRWSNDAIELDTETDAGAGFVLGGISSMGESLNTLLVAAETGAPYPEQPTIGSVMPTIPFVTEQLESVIDKIGLAGKVIDSGVGNPGFTMFCAKHDASTANGRAAGSVHSSTIFGKGQLIIESISANAGQSAVANLQCHALSSDGEASPITRAWNVSLPTWPADDAYTLAGVFFKGIKIETNTSINIAYNVSFEKPRTGSFRYPVLFDVLNVRPIVTIGFDDPQEILDTVLSADAQITIDGKRVSNADTWTLQFRQSMVLGSGSTGAPQPKASAVHITCDLNGFAHVTDPRSASGNAAQTSTVEIRGEENASGVPLIWAKDQVIT